MDAAHQLHNRSVAQKFIQIPIPKPIESQRCKMIISLAAGIIGALAGLVILLAACQILPKGLNAISQWHVGSIILSGAMIAAGVSPIIYGGYQAHQARRMLEIYTRVSNGLQAGGDISNEDMVQYLSVKIRDGKFEVIKDVFPKLDLASQGAMFAIAAEEGSLSEMMDQIPKNIKQLKLSFGNQLHHFDRAWDLADAFVLKIKTFQKLEYITLDLGGVAYYSDYVHNHVEQMLKAIY
jgi:hypothetical protein